MAITDVRDLFKDQNKNKKKTSSGVTDARDLFVTEDYLKELYSSVQNRIESWANYSNEFYNNVNDYYKNLDNSVYGLDSSKEWKDTASNSANWLQQESKALFDFIKENEKYFDSEWVNTVLNSFVESKKATTDIVDRANQGVEYWSQFKDENDYHNFYYGNKYNGYSYTDALEAIKKAEGKESDWLNKNLESFKSSAELQAEIDALNKEYDLDAPYLEQALKHGFGDVYDWLDSGISSNREWAKDEKARLTELKATATRREEAQEFYTTYLPSTLNPDIKITDFDEYVEQGKTKGKGKGDWDGPFVQGYKSDIIAVKEGKLTASGDGFYQKFINSMDDDQYNNYAYLFGKYGKKVADKYLSVIEPEINVKEGQRMKELADAPVLDNLFHAFANLERWADNIDSIFGDEVKNQSPIQIADQLLGAEKKGLEKVLWDVDGTITYMMPSILAGYYTSALLGPSGYGVLSSSTAGAVGQAGVTGLSAYGAGRQEMINLGYSESQANTYGILSGISEAGLQYLINGAGKFKGVLTSKAVERLAQGLNKGIAQFVIEMGGEFTEESAQEILAPFFKEIATGRKAGDIDWGQAMYAGALGALTAGVMNGGGAAVTRVGEVSTARQIKGNESKINTLKEIANKQSVSNLAPKLAAKIDSKTGAWKIANLIHELNGTLSEQNVADIKYELVRSGVLESDAQTIATYLAKAVDGEYFSETQRRVLENNPVVSRVFKKVVLDQNSTVNQRLNALMEVYGREGHAGLDYSAIAESQSKEALSKSATIQQLVKEMQNENDKTAKANEITEMLVNARDKAWEKESKTKRAKEEWLRGQRENWSDPRKTVLNRGADAMLDSKVAEAKALMHNAKVNESGKTTDSTTGKEISIKKVKDSQTKTYELADGSTIKSKNVEYADDETAILYETVLSRGYDTDTANAVINGLKAAEGLSVTQYLNGVDEAIEYGKIGYPMDKITSKGFYADLSESMKKFAYNLGKDIATKETESAQARVDKSKGKVIQTRSGNIIFETEESGMTPRQEASITTLGKIVTDITHSNVHIFESVEKIVNGKKVRVFSKDTAGFKAGTIADNGFYDKSTGDIYIDLHAGMNGEGVILWTAAHELTHFIHQWSPAKFKVLADFLTEEYGKQGVDVRELVHKKMAESKRKNLTYEEAYEEVVADAMQTMFTDTDLASKVEKLKNTDKSLWNKIKQFFRDLYNSIKATYKGLDAQTIEAKLVREMGKSIEKLSDLFSVALVDAGNTYANVDIKAVASGEVDIDGNANAHTFSIRSMAEGAGLSFEYNEQTGEIRILDMLNGTEVTKVTKEQIKTAPLGNIVSIAKENGFISDAEANKQYGFLAELVNLCLDYKENFTMVWEIAGTQVFSAIKANSDTQYGKTIDFSTVCKKTQQVINVVSETQKTLKRGLTKEEIKNIVYEETGKAGEPTPCPVCYVFSRWMGIGGILQQMSDFQKKYEGATEEDMRNFINDVESEIIKHANTPNKKGNLKAEFFDKNGKPKFGTVIADLKAKANNKIKSANIKLKIQETETLLEKADIKDKAKLQNKLKRLNSKLAKEGDILDAKLKEAEALLSRYEEYQWLTKTYMDEVVAEDGTHLGWKRDENFKPVDEDVLWDLREGARFATEFPKSWLYRTTKGCNAGKAILPYSDARVGETIQGVAYSNVKDILVGENNAFLNGDKKAQADYVTKAIKKQLAQNLIGGMRYQSTSDFRYEYGSDYLITFLEMQAIGAKVQLYTKVIESVDFLCTMGAEVNLSVMPLEDGYVELADGKKQLVFSSVTGINAEAAIAKTKQYDNAQLILVGISDEHIRLALEGDNVNGDVVSFVIPFHGSGNTVKVIQELMGLIGENLDVTRAQDYSLVQTDHFAKNRTAEQTALWDLRKKIISRSYKKDGKSVAWDGKLTTAEEALLNSENGSKYLKDLYNRFYVDESADEYGVSLTTAQAEQIFPYEYWDKSLTYAEADQNGERFKDYCATMGIIPRFSGMDSSGKELGYGNFTDTKGYWKLLIDRKMYNNDGTYHSPSKINVSNFKSETLDPAWGSVTYGDVMQKDTNPKKTNAITENVIRQIEAKATDNMMFSMRNAVEETKDLLALHNITARQLMDAIGRNGLLMSSIAITNKSFTHFGDISLAFDKSVIDPDINSANKLYGSDAWTPTQTPIKKNARFDPNKTIRVVNTIKNRIGSKYASQIFDISPKQFKGAIIKADGDIYGAFAYDIGMQTAYAKEKGLLDKIPMSNGAVDILSLKEELDKKISGHDRGWGAYKRWLYDISGDIISAYDTATNEDILQNMMSQPASNKPFKLSLNGDLIVPATEYHSLSDVQKNKNRLSENAEKESKRVANKFLSLAERVGNLTKHSTKDVVNAINSSFENRYDAKSIATAFVAEGISIPNTMAKELQNLYKEAVELPTLYFEAKPQRSLGLNEIAWAVIPNNTDIELKNLLTENGIKFVEYEAGNDNSRLEALNSLNNVKFSERTDNAIDNRSLLVNALESVAQNDVEKSWLAKYKTKIADLNEKQNKLAEIRAEIQKTRFTKGADRSKLSELENNAKTLADQINRADKKLLELEASKALKGVVERERAKAYQLGKAKVEEYRKDRAESTARNYYRPRIEKVVSDLRNRLEHPTAKTAIPEAFSASVAKVLSAFNFTTYDKDGKPRPSKANMSRAEAQVALAELANQLSQNSLESQYGQLDIPPEMLEWINEMADFFKSASNLASEEFTINKMNEVQLKSIYKFIRSLQTALNNAGKYYTNASYDVASDATATMEHLAPLPTQEKERGKKISKMLNWDLASPVTVFDRFGEGGKHVYQMLIKGQSKEAYNVETILDFVEKTYTEKEAKEWRETLVPITIDGKEYNVTIEYLMGLHCLLKQEDSRRHILEGGGIRFGDVKHKGKTTRFTNTFFKETDAIEVEKILDEHPRAREVADAMQKFMEETGSAWGNEVSMTRFGYHAFTIKGYYPIRTIKTGSEYEAQQKRANIYALLNKSFTHERTVEANNAVIVDGIFSVFNNHMSEMALYNAWAMPVIDAIKWFNYKESQDVLVERSEKSVHESLRLAYGTKADEYIRRLFESINGQRSGSLSQDLAFDNLRRVNRVAIAGNVRVALQQPFSITRAFELINPKYVTPLVGKARDVAYEEMLANSGIAKWKSLGYYDVNVSMPLEGKVFKNETLSDKATDKLMKAAEDGDAFTWTALWNACKKETAEKSKGISEAELLNKTAERFNDLVLRTQVVDSVLTKSQWMRADDFWHRATSSFMSEPIASYNALLRQYDKYSRDLAIHGAKYAIKNNFKGIKRAVGIFVLTQLVNALVTAPLDALRDDDDYETYLEKLLANFKDNAIMNLLPTSMIPWIGDVVDYMKYRRTDRSDMAFIIKGVDLAQSIYNTFDNYSYYKLHNTFKQSLEMTSYISGLPIANLWRDAVSIWNTVVSPLGYGELKFQTQEDKHSEGYKKMYDALFNGNKDRAEELYGQLLNNGVEEDSIYNGLVNAVKNGYTNGDLSKEEAAERIKTIIAYMDKTNSDGSPITDNDIYWKIDKWEYTKDNGNSKGYSKYDDIFEAMENGNPSEAIKWHVEDKTEAYLEEARAEAEKNGKSFNETKAKKEAKSKAEASVKSAITSYWKPKYKEAYKNKDDEEMKRIRYMLRDTKLYGTTSELLDTVKGWLKD